MVKVYGPMMSLDASGTLADAISFSTWKGRSYVRERVLPSNPKSGAQVGRRAMFSFLSKNWAPLSPAAKATWQDTADELVASTFNAFIRGNMNSWHNFLAPSHAHPPARDDAVATWDSPPNATWEQHRIYVSGALDVLNQNWGVMIFASPTPTFTTAVANAIMIHLMNDTIAHQWFWTPPGVQTWYFNTRLFSDAGVLGAQGTEFSAIP